MTMPVAWIVPGPLRQVTGGYLYDARVVDGLRARGRPVGVVDLRASRWPLDLAAGRRLTRALGRQRWGAVVVDELAHPALVAALRGGRLRQALASAPLVLLVHHLRCSEPGPWGVRSLARLVESPVIRAADLVVCTSETTAQTVRTLVPSVAVEVVRPGWDTHDDLTPPAPLSGAERGRRGGACERHVPPVDKTAKTPKPPPVRADTGIPRSGGAKLALSVANGFVEEGGRGGEVRLLLVGHWTPRKGILDALEALARVHVPVTLDLVGEPDRDPTYAARVRRALQAPALNGRVRVHGRVPADVLARLYAEADALLLPSTHEGYGMVLAEALAAGLPIVASRVGAIPEVVRDGLEAELVPPGDTSALAGAITRLADPAERQRRAAHARERAASLPRWDESVAAFDVLLTRLMTATKPGR